MKMTKISRVLKSIKRKTSCYTQENHDKNIRVFCQLQQKVMSNFLGQKKVPQYIQSDERKNQQPRISYPAKFSLRIEAEIISCLEKRNEFITTRLALQ